jgi:hypothetical protein
MMTEPAAADDLPYRVVLEKLYRHFQHTGTWPTFAELFTDIVRKHNVNVWDVLQRTPPELLYGVRTNSAVEPGDDDDIGLSIAGLASCDPAGEEVTAFARSVGVAARIALFEPGDGNAELTAGDLEKHIQLPAAGRADLLDRVGTLWMNSSVSSGYSSGTDGWTVRLSARKLWRYKDVDTVEDFLKVQDLVRRAEQPAPTMSLAPDTATDQAFVPGPPATVGRDIADAATAARESTTAAHGGPRRPRG